MFIWISVIAAVICAATLLLLIDESALSRFVFSVRTWLCEATRLSMKAFCDGVVTVLYSACTWFIVVSRRFIRFVSAPPGLVSVSFSASGGIVGSTDPLYESASDGLVPPTLTGCACTVCRQPEAAFASSD